MHPSSSLTGPLVQYSVDSVICFKKTTLKPTNVSHLSTDPAVQRLTDRDPQVSHGPGDGYPGNGCHDDGARVHFPLYLRWTRATLMAKGKSTVMGSQICSYEEDS